MRYANQVSEVLNAFLQEPLKENQMDQFYCNNTMEYRMNDKYSSPIEDIFDMCRNSESSNAFLLLGHRGCGKSTELNHMTKKLVSKGYHVRTIMCSRDLDLLNIVSSDLFILMGEALLEIAEECNCKIKQDILKEIQDFWGQRIETITSQEIKNGSIETELSIETPNFISKILKMFGKIKADLKFNEEIRNEHRRKISICFSEWIRLLSQVSEEISKETEGKRPIIIFEDLDKLNPEDAWKVFLNYAAILSGMSFPVVYTFPIALSYDIKFSALESYFITKTLPMIKIEKITGESYQEGIHIIQEIVKKRANLDLFEKNVLVKMIEFTGGSLRDLFFVINSAAKRAERRKSDTISEEDAERALEELKTVLTRRIERNDYDFLKDIYTGNKEQIEDKQKLLNMLQASVVLEYNGKRWHNVHPLVASFLKEQGLIQNDRNESGRVSNIRMDY